MPTERSSRSFVWWLLVPLCFGWLALRTHSLACKLAVPVSCIVLLLADARINRRPLGETGSIIFALGFSLAGDFFLSSRHGRIAWFLAGIGAFLLAHLAYIRFSLRNGRMRWGMLVLLLIPFLCLHQFALRPGIQEVPLQAGVLAYLLVSCFSFAAACGLQKPLEERIWFQAGIALILFSDTIIGLSEFGGHRSFSWLILPTYYLALISITLSCFTGGGVLGKSAPVQRLPVGTPSERG